MFLVNEHPILIFSDQAKLELPTAGSFPPARPLFYYFGFRLRDIDCVPRASCISYGINSQRSSRDISAEILED